MAEWITVAAAADMLGLAGPIALADELALSRCARFVTEADIAKGKFTRRDGEILARHVPGADYYFIFCTHANGLHSLTTGVSHLDAAALYPFGASRSIALLAADSRERRRNVQRACSDCGYSYTASLGECPRCGQDSP
jgi:hypothetical protein